MIIKFLGTGTSHGVPVIACNCNVCTSKDTKDKRLRSAIFIQTEKLHFIIDTGTDFRQQMLREKIARLDAVLFTHEHRDHTGGLDDIRAFNYLQNSPIPLYGRASVLNQIKVNYAYAFAKKKHKGLPQLTLKPIENNPFKIENLIITPIEGMHHLLPVFGYRINQLAYITDMNKISSKEKKKLLDLDVLVINALQIAPHISHFNLEEAIEIIKEVKPKKAYITHISHNLGLHQTVNASLPKNIALAYDGLEIAMN